MHDYDRHKEPSFLDQCYQAAFPSLLDNFPLIIWQHFTHYAQLEKKYGFLLQCLMFSFMHYLQKIKALVYKETSEIVSVCFQVVLYSFLSLSISLSLTQPYYNVQCAVVPTVASKQKGSRPNLMTGQVVFVWGLHVLTTPGYLLHFSSTIQKNAGYLL